MSKESEAPALGLNLRFVSGRIAIARYGKVFRGSKLKNCQRAGAIGLILYSDPEEVKFCTVPVPSTRQLVPLVTLGTGTYLLTVDPGEVSIGIFTRQLVTLVSLFTYCRPWRGK